MIALGATLGPGGELASPALGALAGCIGGAVATGILLALAGGNQTRLSTVGNTVAGCVVGATLSQIPVHTAAEWLISEFRTILGTGANAIGGSSLQSAAASAQVDLAPMGQAMSNAAAGLRAL